MQTKSPLLKKIVILFISLVIPILIIGIFAVRKSNEKLQNNIITSIHKNNQTYLSQIDTTLNQIYYNNTVVLNQDIVQKLAYLSPFISQYEKNVLINQLRDQLSSICMTQPFVESAHFFFQPSQKIYNSAGYDLGSFQILDEKYKSLLLEVKNNPTTLHYYINPATKRQELSMFFNPSFSNWDYGMILTLSQKGIKDYIESNRSYLEDYYLFSINDEFLLSNLTDDLDSEGQLYLKSLQDEDQFNTYEVITLNNEKYYAFSYKMPYSKGTYIRFIPAYIFFDQLKLSTYLLIILSGVIIVACITFFIGIYRLVHRPLTQLIDAFSEVEQGNFDIQITENTTHEFAYLYSAFNTMTIQLNNLIERDYNQKLLLQKTELKQLQAQINPHFLYNSFFMLQRMIKMDLCEEALEVSNALGDYFRYITKSNMDCVTLYEEYEHAKTYAYIQGLRFEGRIEILFDILPIDCEGIEVPKLILQPILENAFNYGLNDKLQNGLLKVSFQNTLDSLKILVEENGEAISDDQLFDLHSKLEISKNSSTAFEMTGILNIQRRLFIFSNYLSSLQVSRSDLGGLCVTITLLKIMK